MHTLDMGHVMVDGILLDIALGSDIDHLGNDVIRESIVDIREMLIDTVLKNAVVLNIDHAQKNVVALNTGTVLVTSGIVLETVVDLSILVKNVDASPKIIETVHKKEIAPLMADPRRKSLITSENLAIVTVHVVNRVILHLVLAQSDLVNRHVGNYRLQKRKKKLRFARLL